MEVGAFDRRRGGQEAAAFEVGCTEEEEEGSAGPTITNLQRGSRK